MSDAVAAGGVSTDKQFRPDGGHRCNAVPDRDHSGSAAADRNGATGVGVSGAPQRRRDDCSNQHVMGKDYTTQDQVSAGGVAYRSANGRVEVALIHTTMGDKHRWMLPKGKV